MEKIRTRAEVAEETTWNLQDLFATDAEWEAELRSLPEAAAHVETFKGRLGEGAEQLLACLDALEALQERIVKTASYARLKQSEDSTNPVNIENSAKAGTSSLICHRRCPLFILRLQIFLKVQWNDI